MSLGSEIEDIEMEQAPTEAVTIKEATKIFSDHMQYDAEQDRCDYNYLCENGGYDDRVSPLST